MQPGCSACLGKVSLALALSLQPAPLRLAVIQSEREGKYFFFLM